jgi:quercetin dioxygenase-like cupin family protein
MPIQVYDVREDVRNLFVRPEVRGRFLRMEPGEVGPRHSHDVGQELFLILDGECEFEIEGETAVLGPGQLCVAWAGQRHQVRTVGERPMTMFLTVTPHVDPTHTFWADDRPLPPRYGSWLPGGQGDRPVPGGTLPALAGRVGDGVGLLADAVDALAAEANRLLAGVEAANSAGDRAGAKAAVDATWPLLRAVIEHIANLEQRWNDLTGRLAEREPVS